MKENKLPRLAGDQNWITQEMQEHGKVFPLDWIRSFKWGYHFPKLAYDFEAGFNDETMIVVFHGHPNPPEAIIASKRYPAQPWIEKYWKE